MGIHVYMLVDIVVFLILSYGHQYVGVYENAQIISMSMKVYGYR